MAKESFRSYEWRHFCWRYLSMWKRQVGSWHQAFDHDDDGGHHRSRGEVAQPMSLAGI